MVIRQKVIWQAVIRQTVIRQTVIRQTVIRHKVIWQMVFQQTVIQQMVILQAVIWQTVIWQMIIKRTVIWLTVIWQMVVIQQTMFQYVEVYIIVCSMKLAWNCIIVVSLIVMKHSYNWLASNRYTSLFCFNLFNYCLEIAKLTQLTRQVKVKVEKPFFVLHLTII